MDRIAETDIGSQSSEQETVAISQSDTPSSSLVVEIVGNFRMRSQFVTVKYFPFHLGRAYDNDLIISDDTVSPHHLIIDREGDALSVINISQENGSVLNGEPMDAGPAVVQPPSKLTIGRTHIRLLQPNTAVAPTKPLVRLSRVTSLCSNLRVALFLLFSYLLANIFVAVESRSLWMDSNEVVVGELLQLALPLAVAMGMSFISHLLTHYWRFALQLSIACLFLLLQIVLDELYSFISYLMTSDSVAETLNIIVSVCSFALLMAWQLRAISHLSTRLSNAVSGAIVGSFFLIFILQDQVGRPEFIGQPMMHTVLRVNDTRAATDIASIAEFSQQVRADLEAGMNETKP